MGITVTSTVDPNSLFAPLAISVASVNASESTASSSFTDLTTAGPAVTLTTDVAAEVTVSALLLNGTANGEARMAFAVSGATTHAASAVEGLLARSDSAGQQFVLSRVFVVTGLTAGSNTFTAKYATNGTGTATFNQRQITVRPITVA